MFQVLESPSSAIGFKVIGIKPKVQKTITPRVMRINTAECRILLKHSIKGIHTVDCSLDDNVLTKDIIAMRTKRGIDVRVSKRIYDRVLQYMVLGTSILGTDSNGEITHSNMTELERKFYSLNTWYDTRFSNCNEQNKARTMGIYKTNAKENDWHGTKYISNKRSGKQLKYSCKTYKEVKI